MFTDKERAYIESQRLVRIATVDANNQPDVAPVGFEFDGHRFFISGRNMTRTRKYKNVKDGQIKVALVFDDLASVDPWRPRGVRIYGTAEIVTRQGFLGHKEYLRITPQVSWSWGIEGKSFHKTVHTQPAVE